MININMIAERRARKMREMTILRVSMLMLICVTVLMVLWNIAAGFGQLIARNDLKDINQQLIEQKPLVKEWEKVQSQIAERQPVVNMLEQVQKSEGAWMTILADISRVIPGDVVITGLGTNSDADGVSLRIDGKAKDETAVATFMLALRQRTLWSGKPSLKGVNSEATSENTVVRFNMIVPVRGLVGGNL